MKHIILASVSVLAIVAAPAHAQDAQDAPVPQATPAANAPQGGAPSPVAPDSQSGIQDIIVTAQRTEQSAQKAPLPISVVKPEDLIRQNIVRAEDLSRAVPALVAANNGGANTSFFLRGVGNFTSNSYSDPAIAFNYDGVYIGRPSNTQGLFYDLQRVEVLKGPQGTLYGRNATGGAINVIPNRPVVGQTSAEGQASYGNYNAIQAQGDINLPIGDTGAFRLSGTYDRHSGYLSDGTSNQRIWGVRGQVLSNLTPNLTNRIAVDYAHDGGTGAGAFWYGSTSFNGAGYSFAPSGLGRNVGLHDPRSDAYLQQQYIPQVGRTSEALGTYPSQNNGYWGVTDEANWKTSAGTLTVQAAYREGDINTVSTSGGFRDFLTDEHDQQYSAEARFAGTAGPIDYLVGAYYFDERIKSHLAINQLDLTSFQDYKTGTRSEAGFGRLAYHVTPTVTLTAAGRYTHDVKDFDGVSDNYILFCGNPALGNQCPNLPLQPLVNTGGQLANFYQSRGVPVTPVPLFVLPPQFGGSQTAPFLLNAQIPISNATTTTNKFTYRLAADWQVTPGSLVYASYETGFHGGGFSFARGLESYKPETLQAFTIGSKNRFFDRRVQFNVEAFYWKYKDQQFSQFGYDLGNPPSLVFYTSNVGRSTIKGVDADLEVLVTPDTRVSGSVQYLDTVYKSFITYAPDMGLPPNYNCPFTNVIYNGQPSFRLDCSGKPGFNAPKWSFNANVEQTINLDDYRIVLQGGTRYRGAYYVAATYQPWLVSKGAFQSDASISFSPKSDGWFVSGYINNIEDKRRIVLATTSTVNTLAGITTDPRTYGIRIGARFK